MINNTNSSNSSSTFDTIKTKTSETISKIKYRFVNYRKFLFLLVISIILFILMNYIFSKDNFDFLKEYENITIIFYSFLAIFLLGILYSTFILSEKDESRRNGLVPNGYNPDNNILITPYMRLLLVFFIGVILIISIIYGLTYGMTQYPEIITILSDVLIILIIAFGIFGIYKFITGKKRKGTGLPPQQPGGIRLLKNISLYSIFCLLLDIKNFIIDEFNKAPKEVWTILIIEIALIIFYFGLKYIRGIILYIIGKNAKQLSKDPIYLDSRKEIGSADQIYGSNLEEEKYNYNYAISFWFYVNPTANDDTYYNILNYNGKPLIEYNQHKNKLSIKMREGRVKEKIIYLDKNVETQKWNNVVINYQSSTMDIFINNELVKTSVNKMPYMSYDNIISGEDNGIQGGICNVLYFKNNISKLTINMLYYLCNYQNPPII